MSNVVKVSGQAEVNINNALQLPNLKNHSASGIHNGKPSTSFIKLFNLFALLFIFIAASSSSYVDDDRGQRSGGKVLTLNLKGTVIAYDVGVPAIAGSGITAATCFDAELFDLSNGLQIGTATDCLSDIVDNGLLSKARRFRRLREACVYQGW